MGPLPIPAPQGKCGLLPTFKAVGRGLTRRQPMIDRTPALSQFGTMSSEGSFYPDGYDAHARPAWYRDPNLWSWVHWDWKRGGRIAEAVSLASLILALGLTYYIGQSLVGARYEARLAAGNIAGTMPRYASKADPEFKDLLMRLEALDEALAKARASGGSPLAVQTAELTLELKSSAVPPARIVAPLPQASEPAEPVIAALPAPESIEPPPLAASVQPAKLSQPVLQLQPGLRGGDSPDSPYGKRIWLSTSYAPGDPRLVSVVAAGDTMMGSETSALNPQLRPDTDAASVVGSDLAQIFRAADVAFVNLEGPLYDGAGPSRKAGCANCFAFKSPEFYSSILASLGIDVVSLANNHSGDYGAAGRRSTIAALRNAGIAAAGLDQEGVRTASLELPSGKRVGMIAFAPNAGTLNLNDVSAAEDGVKRLAETHDLVIVSFHGGAEGWSAVRVPKASEYYLGENRGDVTRFARRMVDAGASMVIGHGPHVPRAVEVYKGRLIAYSLGNFWTYGVVMNYAVSGLGPAVEAWLTPDGTLAGLQIHSTRQAGLGVPRLDPLDEAARYVMYLTKNDFPATDALLKRAREDAMASGDDPLAPLRPKS